MRTTLLLLALAAFACSIWVSRPARAAAGDVPANTPQFGANNELARPAAYREWIYLSSGMNMAYSKPEAGEKRSDVFTNVFVNPPAYREFQKTGQWPNGTMFALEVRNGRTEGSINKAGQYQGDLRALEASVKDTSRFPEGWAYFGFGKDKKTATPFPKEMCWSCHNKNGQVDNTFVQFYPSLQEIARK